MTDFLMLTIYAPLSSWGDIAVGEVRGSWDRPSRSAILGLVGAALGLDRGDQEAHDALNESFGTAVRVDRVGEPLVDYHTAQTVGASVVKRVRPRTRSDLLVSGEPQTILSRRAYWEDAMYTVALWARADARWTLAQLAEAVNRPAFVLYAGRKANVLGAPLDPQVVTAPTLAGAFVQRPVIPRGIEIRQPGTRGLITSEVSHDAIGVHEGFESGLRPYRRDTRRDVPIHRTRWQFRERTVEIGLLPGEAGTSDQTETP